MKIESRKCINSREILEYLTTEVTTKLSQIHSVTGCETTFLHSVTKFKVLKSL